MAASLEYLLLCRPVVLRDADLGTMSAGYKNCARLFGAPEKQTKNVAS